MSSRFQENNWKGNHFPQELSHISTKNPNTFLLNSELWSIEAYIKKKKQELARLRQLTAGVSEDSRQKLFEKVAPKLRYNARWLEERGLDALGKREENESDSLAQFYKECGIEYPLRASEQVRGSATPNGKLLDANSLNFDSMIKKKNDLRKHDPRIRGMIRLVGELTPNSDFTNVLLATMGPDYTASLHALLRDLGSDQPRKAFLSEEAISHLVNDILENKKMQKRAINFMSALKPAGPGELESHNLLIQQIVDRMAELGKPDAPPTA